jgi:hypothetical protein
MAYRVRAQPEKGFRRSGRFFSSSDWTLLSDEEITPEILAEPLLITEQVPDLPAATPRRSRRTRS